MNTYKAGIDIGSTTVKLVVTDEKNEMIYGKYLRHHANTQSALGNLLRDAAETLGKGRFQIRMTGSGAIGISEALGIEFVQEVIATTAAIRHIAPHTDVAIELGGEDAKIIYFTGGTEERMNGVCAGGTGSFIDQMASLLQTDARGLDEYAKAHKKIYPIAARCGVFAKTDIQPLINEGAPKEDLAASVFQAVVNQTLSALACGRPVKGNVAFLGGPLHYLPELKKAFVRTLGLKEENIVNTGNAHLVAAFGAALTAREEDEKDIEEFIRSLEGGCLTIREMPRLEPLFADSEEYDEFICRHSKNTVRRRNLEDYEGDCFLGIDAGSTTTKIALVSGDGELLFSFYDNNHGEPVRTAQKGIALLAERMPEKAKIVRTCSTGYGEELFKAAFSLDEGVVETIAHCRAAAYFNKDADSVLDIGGQDMKFIKIRDGAVDSILLNEACSSGCGSFIENFATSLGYSAEGFSRKALFASSPADLGTRCTVFMNSNVKQAQKEGADVSDIAAGLAYSVVKNALYKVIKLTEADELGKNVVVQGGTFHNKAVLRALEKITGRNVVCPDICGLMGAFGAALTARENYTTQKSTALTPEEMVRVEYSSSVERCRGCANRCVLTVNTFSGGKKHISGNRCEKGGAENSSSVKAPDMTEYKRHRIFDYEPIDRDLAPMGEIGIPRVLNMYENYPFWATFFRQLGFSVRLSPFSDRRIYESGMQSIPSESECYPAKLVHGHVEWLVKKGVKTIFHPCVFYERQETEGAQNHYNCPIVVSYAENIRNNVDSITEEGVRYIQPFIAFTDLQTVTDRLADICMEEWNIPRKKVADAAKKAWEEQLAAKEDIRKEGKRLLREMERNGGRGIVLAGRPYHMDPEINHGIPGLIASFGLTVFTEDSLPVDFEPERPVRVVDQWVYHSRLYTAAEFVCGRDDLEIVQINSFGCGLDAVTSDQVREILENSNKLYTLIKTDEITNLGAVRIRIRSLIEAMNMRQKKNIRSSHRKLDYEYAEFTEEMFREGYTILAPQMSPVHFDILGPVFRKHGFNIEVLDNDNREAIDTGLEFVNNDACFPSVTVVGQIMQAVLSGKYDTDRLAVIMTQTGGCCRASNYVAFIRRALESAGLAHIPVISLNYTGLENHSGFRISASLLMDAVQGIVYGDLLMRCLYRTRPYEKVKGSADALYEKHRDICIGVLTGRGSIFRYKDTCRRIVEAFDELPLDETIRKPRVGVVGEILVKYMPLANNNIVGLLEKEGAEAVVPDLMDFANYCIYNHVYKSEYLGEKKISGLVAKVGVKAVRLVRRPALKALKKSRRFDAPMNIEKIAELTGPFLSLGNQYGEGWFLAGEMAELLMTDVPNIICIQPFACLPNHVVGKGVIKALKKAYPQANITAVDYDPGASGVNQLNRIKLLLSAAKREDAETFCDAAMPAD